MGLCSCTFWLQIHLLVLSATIFQEDFISTFLEDRYDASYQGKDLRVLLAYKRFGMHKVTAPQLWNKPTICATSHWVSSAPHPWDRVSKEKDVSMCRGMGGVDEAFLVCFYCCFISTNWFILKKRKRKEGKGRERKEWRLIWSIKLWTAQLSLVIQGGLVLGLMQIPKSVDVQVPYTLVNFSWSSVPHEDLVDTKGG